MQLTRDDRTGIKNQQQWRQQSQGWGNRAVAMLPPEILPCLEEQD